MDGLPLSARASMRIHFERGRHVRVAELCLRHAQWCSLLVKKCSVRVPERMSGNRRESGDLTCRMQLPLAQGDASDCHARARRQTGKLGGFQGNRGFLFGREVAGSARTRLACDVVCS
jgi:hypothetical protein